MDDAFLAALEKSAPLFNLDPAAPALAGELVALTDGLDADERAAALLLILTTMADVQQGSTRTVVEGEAGRRHLTRRFHGLCREGELEAPDVLAAGLVARVADLLDALGMEPILSRDAEAYRPLLLENGWLYQARMRTAEARLASGLAYRLGAPPDALPRLEAVMDDMAARPALRGGAQIQLTDEQRSAVAVACRTRVSLISGGPGTGKTSIVVGILRALARLGVGPSQIALAAPTGKAAWRMGESVRQALTAVAEPGPADELLMDDLPSPKTLHRLLGYSPRQDRFAHHHNNPLTARAVIVDEASMIDVFMMERLISAVGERARLVLLGDADQLPSVAAGAVFRDVISLPRIHKAWLTRSFRMRDDNPHGARILRVAQAMNRGDLRGLPISVRARAAEVEGLGVERVAGTPEVLKAFIDRWYDENVRGSDRLERLRRWTWRFDEEGVDPEDRADLDELFQFFGATRLLCLTRGFDTGAERLNARLHLRAARDALQEPEIPFLVGEPVMMLHNDYDRGLFNGDQGLCLWVSRGGDQRRMAVFPESRGVGYRAFALDALGPQLELCYAMTVHKAQGSEFEQVAVVLPEKDLPLLTRELVYTAVTRARTGVTIIGSEALLERAVSRPSRRQSGLADRLRAAQV